MQLFYYRNTEGLNLSEGQQISLDEEESMHAIKVLRHRLGDEIWVTDGAGKMMHGVIDFLDKKECKILINSIQNSAKRADYHLHLAIAPTKNIARFEWFLEKATEIGIDEITPLICHHSERREINHHRLLKVITSAMKQSLKTWHPLLHEASIYHQFIKKQHSGANYIAHLAEPIPLHLAEIAKNEKHITVIIGPEGDFSEDEIELAIKNQWQLTSLGTERLRTETAALVAVTAINLINL